MVFIQILHSLNIFYTLKFLRMQLQLEQEEFRLKARKVSGTEQADGETAFIK